MIRINYKIRQLFLLLAVGSCYDYISEGVAPAGTCLLVQQDKQGVWLNFSGNESAFQILN